MIHNLVTRRETLKDSIEAVLDKSHEALYRKTIPPWHVSYCMRKHEETKNEKLKNKLACVSLAPQAMQNFLENMENRQNCIMECVEALVRDIEFNIRCAYSVDLIERLSDLLKLGQWNMICSEATIAPIQET